MVRIRPFPIVRTSWPVLHRLEADAAHGGVEWIDGDRSEVQPVAAERVFEREDVAGERLAGDDGAQLERETAERREHAGFEMEGVDMVAAKEAMRLASAKLPILTKFATRFGETEVS